MAAVTWLVDPYPSSTGPLKVHTGVLTACSQQVALGPLPELKAGEVHAELQTFLLSVFCQAVSLLHRSPYTFSDL